jgi:N-acetylglucosaminyldiphosphoundecaprenol N-acetyl-beta-D-mannosaminyltransferase
LPISQSILKGARFLRRDVPYRYMPFEFVISLLRALERWGKSAYMFGARRKVLLQAEKNLRQTFPGLKIVGRYQGFYPKTVEEAVIEAIRKSTPTLLMVGTGVPGREKWIRRNMKRFQSGIYLWVSDCFEVFAEKRRRVSRKTFSKSMEFVPYTLRRPWKLLRFFVFVYYKMLLLIYRLRKL